MAEFTIVEAKLHDCGKIARLLREGHKQEIVRLGLNAHRGVRTCFSDSYFRKAWMIDGRLAAVGGVMGPRMALRGHIWLALSDEATRYPIAVAREAKKQIASIMGLKREIVTTVSMSDPTALRFASYLGFKEYDEKPIKVGGGHLLPMIYSE